MARSEARYDDSAAASPAPGEPTTLARFCADLGPDLVKVTLAPRGLEPQVRNVWLHDPLDPPPGEKAAGGLLLLVGASPRDRSLEPLLRDAAAAGATAVACRSDDCWSQSSLETATACGLALLTVPPAVGWGELYELAHAAVVADLDQGGDGDSERTGLADLSATVEALAAITGGSVTIDDMQSRVLAFSGGGKIDQMRTASILNRRLPEQWLAEMRRRGVIEQLLTSEDVIHVNFGESQPRRAIAIRLGKSVLGSIWLAGEDQKLSPDADDALRRAAPIAALQLMRQRVVGDVERRMRESALAALLRGEESSPPALDELGLGEDERYIVLAIEVTARSISSPPAVGPRLIDLVTLHLGSYDRPALATSIEDGTGTLPERIYVVTGSRGDKDRVALARIAAECLDHAAKTLGVELRAGISHAVRDAARLPLARRSAEDCLDLGADRRVVAFEEIRDQALLSEVERFVADWRTDPPRAFAELVEHDRANGTEYLRTLRCLFDAFGNAATVAEKLHLHPNTVRYRIKRIHEITGVDLADGDARLALELTLRAQLERPPQV